MLVIIKSADAFLRVMASLRHLRVGDDRHKIRRGRERRRDA
jgi:hypothetical protein